MSDLIYRVTTEGDVEGRTTTLLGYCTGEVSDIKAYYDNKKVYDIAVEPITVKHISSVDTAKKIKLLQRKKEIESELEFIEKQIK